MTNSSSKYFTGKFFIMLAVIIFIIIILIIAYSQVGSQISSVPLCSGEISYNSSAGEF